MKNIIHRMIFAMDWSDDNHYILFVDIMGFKEMVFREKHSSLYKMLCEFQNKNKKMKPLLEYRGNELMRISHFSDSIMIASLNADKKSLNRIIKAASIIMRNGLECGFALRGAIAKSKLTFDCEINLYFGKAIIDAYCLEGQLNFYGIVFHHSAENDVAKIIKNPSKNKKRESQYIPVVRADVPFKNGMSEHYCVAYHLIDNQLDEVNTTNETLQLLNKLYTTVSGEPRVYLDNTIKFIKTVQSL